MFRSAILVAAISGSVVSSSFGGFVVTWTTTSVDATLDRIDIYARNTGGDTGTGLLAVELTSAATAGEAVWRSTSAGNWSPTNPADIANRSQVRIDMEDVSSTSLVSKTPAANQPLAAAYGPLTVALGSFNVVIAGLSGAVPAETGNGAHFASLFVSKNFASTITGNVGGSAGAKVPFWLGHGDNFAPTINSVMPNPINVVFGSIVTNGATFSTTVNATDPEGDPLAFDFPMLPQGVSGMTVTPMGGANYIVSGTVDYSTANGPTVVIPFSVSDATHTTASPTGIHLHVTPEPSMLSLAGASVFVRRRR